MKCLNRSILQLKFACLICRWISQKKMTAETCSQPLRSSVGFQDGVADTECAHALLELAMSVSPPSYTYGLIPTRTTDHSLSPPSPLRRTMIKLEVDTIMKPQASLLKRQLEGPYDTDPAEIYRAQLVKRIRLDHNYYWSADDRTKTEIVMEPDEFKSYCESIKQINHTQSHDDVEMSFGGSKPSKVNKENGFYRTASGKGHARAKKMEAKKSESLLKQEKKVALKSNPLAAKKGFCFGDPYEFKDEDSDSMSDDHQNQTGKSTSPRKSSKAGSQTNKMESSRDEDRYRGFHLLLKCLSENDDSSMAGSESGQFSSASSSMDDDGSQLSSDDSETESEDETGFRESSNCDSSESEYQCDSCFRTFSKKRYLTKHQRRMHPVEPIPEPQESLSAVCPNCLKVVSKKNFKRHLAMCDELKKPVKPTDQDLADCQFCNISMKRHLLVRHLAQEHCVEKGSEFAIGYDFDSFMDDDIDSKPGSLFSSMDIDVPLKTQDMAVCELCDETLPRTLMKQHMADKHEACPLAKVVPCEFCGLELTKSQLMKHLAHHHCIESLQASSILNNNNNNNAATTSSLPPIILEDFMDTSNRDAPNTSPSAHHPAEEAQSALVKVKANRKSQVPKQKLTGIKSAQRLTGPRTKVKTKFYIYPAKAKNAAQNTL